MKEIENYLSEDEKKEIATRVFAERVQRAFGGDQYSQEGKEADRVIKNAIAHWITEYVQSCISEEDKVKIRVGVDKAINSDDYSFYLFKKPDVWDRSEYTAHKIITEALKENEDFIKRKVKESIEKKFEII